MKGKAPAAGKRKKPTLHEKLASALLHIRKGSGDDWLVKGELREASAKEICAAIDFDHIRRWAEGGDNRPQNLQPLMRADHREKTKTDITEVAKGKRFGQAHKEFQARLLAKQEGTPLPKPARSKKGYRKMQSRNSFKKEGE